MTAHHVDCDGYRTEHRSAVGEVRTAGTDYRMYVAACDECGPLHVGLFGPAARGYAEQLASRHGREVECDGRCLAWDDPEYADVDEAGQLALGIPGEQRSFPGLAAAIQWQNDRKEEERP